MHNYKPLVTVITAVYNGDKYIEKTIRSVLNQSYSNIEYIIIDGGSQDKTKEIVYKYMSKISVFISEPDNGIYDAWNKGIKCSNGDLITFCSADDYLDTNAIEMIVSSTKQISSSHQEFITYGNVQLINDKGSCGFINGSFNRNKLYRGFGFLTTSVFFSRKCFSLVGLFDTKYKIAGDSEWLLRAYNKNVNFFKCENLVYMRNDGVSNKFELKAYIEYVSALKLNKLITFKSYYVLFKKFIKDFIK